MDDTTKAQVAGLLDTKLTDLTVREAVVLAVALEGATDDELAALGVPRFD